MNKENLVTLLIIAGLAIAGYMIWGAFGSFMGVLGGAPKLKKAIERNKVRKQEADQRQAHSQNQANQAADQALQEGQDAQDIADREDKPIEDEDLPDGFSRRRTF